MPRHRQQGGPEPLRAPILPFYRLRTESCAAGPPASAASRVRFGASLPRRPVRVPWGAGHSRWPACVALRAVVPSVSSTILRRDCAEGLPVDVAFLPFRPDAPLLCDSLPYAQPPAMALIHGVRSLYSSGSPLERQSTDAGGPAFIPAGPTYSAAHTARALAHGGAFFPGKRLPPHFPRVASWEAVHGCGRSRPLPCGAEHTRRRRTRLGPRCTAARFFQASACFPTFLGSPLGRQSTDAGGLALCRAGLSILSDGAHGSGPRRAAAHFFRASACFPTFPLAIVTIVCYNEISTILW